MLDHYLIYKNKIILAVLLLIVFTIYYRAVNGPYVFDDFPNLLQNDSLILDEISFSSIKDAVLSSPSSNFYRPISMLTFSVNYTLAGNKNPYSVKLTNIFLHLLAGIGIYLLTLRIYRSLFINSNQQFDELSIHLIPFFVTSFWLLHPLFVSTVLYSVQRMAILSGLIIIYGCVGYFKYREKTLESNNGYFQIAFGALLLTIAAFLCKENGILLPVFLLVIELFFFRFKFHEKISSFNRSLLVLTLLLPAVFVLTVLLFYCFNISEGAIQHYGFNPSERLLSEARILWMYVGWLLFLNPEPMSLFNDNFELSTGLLHPVTTLISVGAWVVLFLLGLFLYKRFQNKILLFSLSWFLVGHLIESTVIPLLLVFEHRNYLPGYGIIIAFVHYIFLLIQKINSQQIIRILFAAYLFFILPAYTLNIRVSQWETFHSLTSSLLRARPDSTWTWVMVTNFLSSSDDYENAVSAVRNLQRMEPDATHIFSEAILHCVHNKEERFNNSLIQKLRHIDYAEVYSMSELSSFKMLSESCSESYVNIEELLSLYQSISKFENEKLERYRKYAIQKILESSGNQEDIINIKK